MRIGNVHSPRMVLRMAHAVVVEAFLNTPVDFPGGFHFAAVIRLLTIKDMLKRSYRVPKRCCVTAGVAG